MELRFLRSQMSPSFISKHVESMKKQRVYVRAFCREMIEGISYAPLLQNMQNSIEVFMKREHETNRV